MNDEHDHANQQAALAALLDGDDLVAKEMLADLDVRDLQDLAFACEMLATLCRDAALATVWPDDRDFFYKKSQLGTHGKQRKDPTK